MKTASEAGSATVLRDLFTSVGPCGRPALRSLLYLIPIALVVLLGYHDLYSGTAAPTTTAHPEQSLNVALNAHFCGNPKALSVGYSVQAFLSTHLDLMAYRFRRALNTQAGGVAAYCATVTDPVVLSENSLMWLMRLALKVNSRLSPDGLGQFLGASRVAMLLLFGFALLRTGASVLFALAAVLVGCAILRALGVRDSVYPFGMTLPLLLAAIYGLSRSSRAVMSSVMALCVVAFGMGALSAFSASMRTINLPLAVMMFAVFLFVWLRSRNRRSTTGAAVLAVAAPVAVFALGYAAYGAVFISPLVITGDPKVSNYVYHPFAHQIVIGLAVPENDLSRREGIEWLDESGVKAARRMIPDATYVGPTYERALRMYYWSLWRSQPAAMAALYARKLHATGTEVFLSAALIGTQFGIPRAPAEFLHRVTDGYVLLALALLVFGLGLRRHLQTGDSRLLIVSLASIAALATMGESFFTYSIFVGIYSSSLLFFVFFALLVAVQALVDRAARLAIGVQTGP